MMLICIIFSTFQVIFPNIHCIIECINWNNFYFSVNIVGCFQRIL